MQPNNDEAIIPEEGEKDTKLPAKRPRRKAALKSVEKMMEQAAKDEADDMEEDEDSKPAAKKRPRRKSAALKKSDEEPSSEGVVMNVDAMVTVMEFLPPRSLMNVALTCKSLLSRVTTTMVVRSALIHGDNAKKTFEELYKLMKNHSIHPPSPLRLLRLANGRKCEFCVKKNVLSLYQDMNIGAFSCWNCLTKAPDPLTMAFKSSWSRCWRNPIYRCILNHPRLASRNKSKGKFLWIRDRLDAHGDKIGPLVLWKNIDEMANSTEGKNKTALLKAGGHNYGAYNTERDSLGLGINAWIDQYMTDNLSAPPKEDYAEFIEAYTDITERAERIVREKEQKRREKRQAKEEKRQQREKERRAIVDKFLLDLESLIDEPYRSSAMKKCSSYYGRRTFDTPFIEDIMDPYVSGYPHDEAATEAANKINEILRLFPKLVKLDFLSDDDTFESAALAFFREKFPNVEALFNNDSNYWSNGLNSKFVDLLKDGQSFKALSSLERNDLSPILLATEPTASLANSSSHLNGDSIKNLARRVWRKHWDHLETDSSFDSTKNTLAFQASHNYFGQVLAKVERYATFLREEADALDEDRRKSMVNEVISGYNSQTLDYFMEQNEFELVKKYQVDTDFRWDEIRRMRGQN
ncbi:hypothetical protein ACHAWC_010176 [Mediolabrus comicus]